MDGTNNRLHAKQTAREQRFSRFTKEREPQITERNLLKVYEKKEEAIK
jgi:hypothetical protein